MTGSLRTVRARGPAAGVRAASLLIIVASVAASGASCPQVLRGYQVGTMPLPRTLPAHPSLDQIIAAVHDNTQRVRSCMATQAVLVVPGVPRLSARVACEPPRRFRLQAQTAITGPELDIGSNDDLFWLWLRQHKPPIVAFCRHDQYAQSAARRLLPIRADWMPEMLGLVNFRPEDRHQGPFPLPDGRIEIRSTIDAADGELLKSTILDGTTGAGQRAAPVHLDRRAVSERADEPPSRRSAVGGGAAAPRRGVVARVRRRLQDRTLVDHHQLLER